MTHRRNWRILSGMRRVSRRPNFNPAYFMVKRASIRSGGSQPFQLAGYRRSTHPRNAARLSRADVTAMRSWAGGEGWGLTRQAQATVLVQRYPYVTVSTIKDVLAGMTWYDPAYVPGALDQAYWQAASPTAILLRALKVA